ncbi:MAG: penicillin acylase family protein, partial [Actinomycetota bacterium]
LDLVDVADLDDLIDTHARHQGVPLFNTVAAGAEGRVWYADTSATPNLTPDAQLIYLAKLLDGDPLTTAAESFGVVLLDGSDSRFRWAEADGARDPGLVPFAAMPMTERLDHVFNANDSYWINNATAPLVGDFSILHGRAEVPLSPRSRQNALVLAATDRFGLTGDDRTWTADEVRAAAFDNLGNLAWVLVPQVVEACRAAPLVEVEELLAADGTVGLPAEAVDLTAACDVLAGWDGRYDLDRAGPLLWREVIERFDGADLRDQGALYGDSFVVDQPATTPNQLAEDTGPVLQALARAVQTLQKAGFAVDATLGSAQFTERAGERIPLHGGTNDDGVTNIVSWGGGNSSLEPGAPTRGDQVAPGSSLRADGHPVNFGTSFVMVVDYSSGAPEASAILTYGNSDLRDETTAAQADRFSQKNWRTVRFTEADITADRNLTERVVIET